ncbi:MAG: O-antigen ligase family protein [Chitinophagaceae bacterium]
MENKSEEISPLPLWGLAFLVLACCITVALTRDLWWMAIPVATLIGIWTLLQYRSVYFLLLLTLPLSTAYHFSPTLGTDFPDEFLMIGLTMVTLLLLSFTPKRISPGFWKHPLILILCLQLVWSLVPAIFSTGVLVSLKYLAAKGWYLLTFVVLSHLILQQKRNLQIAFWCIFLPLLFTALQSLVRHAAFGFTFASINHTLNPFFINHVMYSSMLVAMTPFLVAAFLLAKKGSLARKFLGVSILVFAAALVFSYARGAWLALLVGLLAYICIRLRIMAWMVLGIYLLMGTTCFFLAQKNRYLNFAPNYNKTIYHSSFRHHWKATYEGRDLSTEERFYRWIAAVRMIRARPLVGVGENNFYSQYKKYGVSAFKTYVSNNPDHSTVHNYFLYLGVEQGIPGMLLYALLIFYIFYRGQKIYDQLDDPFEQIVCMATLLFFSMLCTVNFLSDLIETDKIGSLFYIAIAVLVNLELGLQHPTDQPKLQE